MLPKSRSATIYLSLVLLTAATGVVNRAVCIRLSTGKFAATLFKK